MSKKVSSEDYIKLRKLLSSGHSPIEVSIEVNNNEEKVKITLLSPDNKQKIFKSTEEDVVLFAFSIQNMCDVDGNFSLGEVKNLEEFFNNLQKLYDPDNKKFHEARIKVLRGETTIEYVPHRLLREFLELGKYSNSKSYSLLRDDYFIIKYLHIEQLKQVNDGLLRIRNQNSKKTEIFNLVLDLFRRSFHKDPNFLKNYQLFQKYNIAESMDLLV